MASAEANEVGRDEAERRIEAAVKAWASSMRQVRQENFISVFAFWLLFFAGAIAFVAGCCERLVYTWRMDSRLRYGRRSFARLNAIF